MSTETLLFSGTDLRSVCLPEDLNEFWGSLELRGELPTAPGVDGARGVPRPAAANLRSGTVSVAADTYAETRDAVAAVKALLRVGVEQVVTRRKVTTGGNLDATQAAIVRGSPERWDGGTSCTLLIDVELLDGIWYGSATAIANAAGTYSVAGDLSTHRMTVTLAAGAARTVTNTTNGHWFTFSTAVPAGGVLIDVEAQTAIAITGGADMSRYLSWSKAYPMRLNAGSNTVTVSAGTASISYQPAYQ